MTSKRPFHHPARDEGTSGREVTESPFAMSPAVLETMQQAALAGHNPSSMHRPGQRSRRAIVEVARSLTRWAGLPRHQVIWTASPLEADALACIGRGAKRRGRSVLICGDIALRDGTEMGLEACLRAAGLAVEQTLSSAWDPKWCSSDLWVVPSACPVSARRLSLETICSEAARCGAELHIWRGPPPVAATGWEPDRVSMTFDAMAFGGPSGIAALVIAKKPLLEPLWQGGGQQEGQRPGTLPRDLIAGMGAAAAERMAFSASAPPPPSLFWPMALDEAARLGSAGRDRGLPMRWGRALDLGSGLAVSRLGGIERDVQKLLGASRYGQHLTIDV